MTTTKADVYARVTNCIIEHLENGVRPWMRPWNATHTQGRIARPLRHNGEPYSGINVLLLWGNAMDKGFAADTWMTYKQATSMGAQVRKGERGSLVVYADRLTKIESDHRGEEVAREIAFMKAYTVFNVEQIDSLPDRYSTENTGPSDPLQLIEASEHFFESTEAAFRHGGNRAFYSPSQDFIQLPPAAAFKDAESYAATKAHELIHWTGNEHRLARTFGKRFGDHAYACEELVAELGAAFLCADLGVTPDVRDDHAAYLAHWLEVLKTDKRAIFTAAAEAQRASDFLQRLQEGR